MMVVFGHLNPVRADGWNWTGQYAVHIVCSLLGIDSRKVGPTIAKLDKVLGDLAYPIFSFFFFAFSYRFAGAAY